jgi:hypothetical protein
MTLGLALILIFILYLIDKHNRWREAAKVVAGLIVLSVLAAAGSYGWPKYDEYRTAKREAAQQAALKKSIQDCITRNSLVGPRDIFDDLSAQDVCEKDPGTLPPCWSKPPSPEVLQFDQNNDFDLKGNRIPPDPKATCFPMEPLTQIYEFDGKRYEVPKGTTFDELDAAIKQVRMDPAFAKGSLKEQRDYLAYLIETYRKKGQGKTPGN